MMGVTLGQIVLNNILMAVFCVYYSHCHFMKNTFLDSFKQVWAMYYLEISRTFQGLFIQGGQYFRGTAIFWGAAIFVSSPL